MGDAHIPLDARDGPIRSGIPCGRGAFSLPEEQTSTARQRGQRMPDKSNLHLSRCANRRICRRNNNLFFMN
jgi:hypothetical protein